MNERPNKPTSRFRKFAQRRSPAIKEVLREPTAGGIIFRRNPKNDEIDILLIQDARDRWTIPKGHMEEGETPKETAEREVKEETGLKTVIMHDWLGKINFQYRRQHSLVLITQDIFLVHANKPDEKLVKEDWMNDIRWFSAKEALEKIEYDDIGKIMLIALKKIRGRKMGRAR